MKHTHTVTITIGRNLSTGRPMPQVAWSLFKTRIGWALDECEAQVIQRPQMGKMRAHDQVGLWEGQREAAATFVAFISGYRNIARLRETLATIATVHGQQCIGCVVTLGCDHLVYA